jgi:manganese-dependent inorganic pyrophosphatase
MKKILITSYINPDLDGVAGIFAYNELLKNEGKEGTIGVLGEVQDEVKYIFDYLKIKYPYKINNSKNFDEVILIDASHLNTLGRHIEPDKVVEIIDHRKVHETEKFPNAKVQIELVGAAATLVVERLIQGNVSISVNVATLLLGAIISNTFNLKSSITTDRDRKVVEYLSKKVQLPENFWEDFFIAKSDLSGEKLAQRMEIDIAIYEAGKKKVGICQLEIYGARKLVAERETEIINILKKIKDKSKLDIIFLNIIRIDELKNFFITWQEETKKLLEKVLKITFNGDVAENDQLIMRKQIIPLLKEELEK